MKCSSEPVPYRADQKWWYGIVLWHCFRNDKLAMGFAGSAYLKVDPDRARPHLIVDDCSRSITE